MVDDIRFWWPFVTEPLPLESGREELRNKAFVVRPQFIRVGAFVAFAVEVVRVKGLDSREAFLVLLVAEVLIRTLAMPRVETMVTNHGEALCGKGALVLENVVEVLGGELSKQGTSAKKGGIPRHGPKIA